MKIAFVNIKNFRGISEAKVFFNGHSVLIGDNNAGKSTIFEAIDLVLGPDRMNKLPVVDEHDFYNGKYYSTSLDASSQIEVEVLIIDLEISQIRRFKNNLEFWNINSQTIVPAGSIAEVDGSHTTEALRIKFVGKYNEDDDDFEGDTYYCSPVREDEVVAKFTKGDKRECGFLYLRALRTGARALSMERGSLLDIILRIKEIRPKMWEDVLDQLRETPVATDPEIGIKGILEGIQEALREFVPADWGSEPHLKVSDLTREHLRKTLTVFMSTGGDSYHAPFHHQGTGTINTMVLALLSMIADAKKNVIFAMEEPEIAIPPYTQKRIINSIRNKSTQAIFTSHSPFVLEEFSPSQIILIQRNKNGVVASEAVKFPGIIKPKNYNAEFRLRFCEALLAKRVLLTEGYTEATSYSAVGRRLNELAPKKYYSLEAMGVAIFNVMSESAISIFGDYFTKLGKTVFAVFDKQDENGLQKIVASVKYPFESKYKGFEDLLLKEISEEVLKQYYQGLIQTNEWPSHITKPVDEANIDELQKALKKYLKHYKGAANASELIAMCKSAKEVPKSLRVVMKNVKENLENYI
jgi:putative ATP-dependent endonuclease of OLD family